MPDFIAVIAASPSGVIGRDGGMPWQLSSDLRRFKRLTLGAPILMGRRTYDSIGRPLPGRRNLVLSRQGEFRAEGVEVFGTVEDVERATADSERVYVIGGATIYQALLPRCQEILLTRVWTQTAGDTVVPLDLKEFSCTHVERVPQGPRDSVPTEFQVWRRR